MNVRFKKTDKGEIAILPRKEYEALTAKAVARFAYVSSSRTSGTALRP